MCKRDLYIPKRDVQKRPTDTDLSNVRCIKGVRRGCLRNDFSYCERSVKRDLLYLQLTYKRDLMTVCPTCAVQKAYVVNANVLTLHAAENTSKETYYTYNLHTKEM